MAIIPAMPPRARKVKVLATLGPASSDPAMIEALMRAGADAFRINMSHGDHADKAALVVAIRALEKKLGRPTTILFDLQGPKLRVGDFDGGSALVATGDSFVFDRDPALGNATRVELPHPELFEAVKPGAALLVDDGKVRLKEVAVTSDRIETRGQRRTSSSPSPCSSASPCSFLCWGSRRWGTSSRVQFSSKS